jgi:hypothetical protein
MWSTKFEQNTVMYWVEKTGWKGRGTMNEIQLSKKFMNRIKSALPPEAVIFRHVEHFTRGVPDYSVTVGSRTAWIEFKLHGVGKFSKIQTKHIKMMGNLFLVFLGSPVCGPFETHEEWKIDGILSFLLPTRK